MKRQACIAWMCGCLCVAPAWAQFVVGNDGKTLHHQSGLELSQEGVHEWGQVHFPTVDVAWWTDDAGQPRFAVVRDDKALIKVAQHTLYVQDRGFDPVSETPTAAARLLAKPGGSAWVVQFHTQPLEPYRDALAALGADVRKYMAQQAYLVEVPADRVAAIRDLAFVRAVIPYHPAFKLDPLLVPTALATDGDARRYNLLLHDRSVDRKAELVAAITVLGGTVHTVSKGGLLASATLTPAALRAVADRPEILAIDEWTPIGTDIGHARQLSGVDGVRFSFGMTGDGVRGEVMDTNVRASHFDFQDPPIIFHGGNGGNTNHGTGTFGITFGSGIANPNRAGIVPDAQGIFADTGFLADRFAHTAELLEPPFEAVFQSNSWGNAQTNVYNSISADFDDILFRNDILVTQSQSNRGTRDSRPQAWAKNVVSVGGVQTQGTATLDDDCWCNGASIGPATDGRIKPDLVHVYDGVITVDNANDSAYGSFCCTSAATPIVGGCFGLLFQAWHEGFFGDVTGATVFDSKPHATTAKALMINTARRYGFLGQEDDLTRAHQGWGMPDLQALFERADRMFIVDETDVLGNLDSVTYTMDVAPDEEWLWITMTYADPGGTTIFFQHRINDLTLKVTSPTGIQYWGNHGLRDSNFSTSGGSADRRDTVENVFIGSPLPGRWTIEISADEVNEDSHLETPEVDADFALVVSGATLSVCNGFLVGDANCDGVVSVGDINAFVLALTDPAAYASTYPDCDRICTSDISQDGDVTVADINGFVSLLTGP